MRLRRRTVLWGTGSFALPPIVTAPTLAAPSLAALSLAAPSLAAPSLAAPGPALPRARPRDPDWPGPDTWDQLNRAVGSHLVKVKPLFAACENDPAASACAEVLRGIKNPYYIRDQPAATQTSGWVDAWTSQPSAYAVAASSVADVAAAVNFARTHRLRLVIKGGGHSYLGGSNAADSLLVWTRPMDRITLHDDFVGQGCTGKQAAVPAVSVGAGALWLPVYQAVTTAAGRYVQGGGCTTVGVAGLVLGNGFGSFSKRYGPAGIGLIEAEIVTADGRVRIANACSEPDLFWALKGGGNGGFGVVTRLTLRTHTIPEFCGGVFGAIKANSDAAFRRLIAQFNAFYAQQLFNRHWGEQAAFRPDNILSLALVFHDRTQAQAEADCKPLLDFVAGRPADYAIIQPVRILALPARHFWDADYLAKTIPSFVVHDPRVGAPAGNFWWAGNQAEVGFFLHGYESAWLPAPLLDGAQRTRLDDALFAASRHWPVTLHYNKGLAGAPAEVTTAARATATNPAMAEAFALAIVAHGGPPAFPGMPGPGPDLALARRNAAAISRTIGILRDLVPDAGSYVSEAGFADPDWRQRSFGGNYQRLLAVKRRYDPDGLFVTHHGVGSEGWTQDGFTPI